MNWETLTPYILEWTRDHGLQILLILVLTFLLHRFSHTLVERGIRKAVTSDRRVSPEAEKKREDTLIQIFHQAVLVTLWIFAGLAILTEVGINTAPLIAGAGIVGIAVGFGGQYLIKDLITGFFIILENQYRVGDVVCFGQTCGLVERINLRTTMLRDLDGTVHHVPNGEVKIASNLSKNYSRVNLNVRISYNADLAKVIKVVNKVGNDLAKDKEWKDMIKKPPQFLRVEDFSDSAVVIKVLGDTQPIKQWEITGELRKRLKFAFDKEGIEIPLPQRVIHTAS